MPHQKSVGEETGSEWRRSWSAAKEPPAFASISSYSASGTEAAIIVKRFFHNSLETTCRDGARARLAENISDWSSKKPGLVATLFRRACSALRNSTPPASLWSSSTSDSSAKN